MCGEGGGVIGIWRCLTHPMTPPPVPPTPLRIGVPLHGAGTPARTLRRLVPQSFEAVVGHACILHGVLRISVAEEVLRCPEVHAFVGEVVAAGMPQHVRDQYELCGHARRSSFP